MKLDPVLFNVRHNGVDIAEGISRDEASAILDAPGRPGGSWQVYRQLNPLEGRKAFYRPPTIPRRPSLRVSPAERARLVDRLQADGTMTTAAQPAHSATTEERIPA